MFKGGNVYMKYYDTTEAANILHLKPITVRNYCASKIIKANLIGNKYLIAEEDLVRFINMGQTIK